MSKILILGVNGFIGSALAERLLEDNRHEVHGVDLRSDRISHLRDREDFQVYEADIVAHHLLIDTLIKRCDIIIPLAAIAIPADYIKKPLQVFELNFEENLRIIKQCVQHKKRLIFPSTSEVYGMSDDKEFSEISTNPVLGPIWKQRWIYSNIKQLLDRVIWAYGMQEDLQFTIFRPFNWIGPRLDSLELARSGRARVLTQMIQNLVDGTPIQLIDGGKQQRCFASVSDGVECLGKIIDNQGNVCDGNIINIGNPDNEVSIAELAKILVGQFEKHPLRSKFPPFAGILTAASIVHYGEGYQDVQHRKPCIRIAKQLLGWEPTVGLDQAVRDTLDFFLNEASSDMEARN